MNLNEKLTAAAQYAFPDRISEIPHGDMPGDKVEIGEAHIKKAAVIMPELIAELKTVFEKNKTEKAVITVCGGSGVGKSEIASLITYCLNQNGIGAYTLSGDNYPHRIPEYNDAERLRIFRESGMRGMVLEHALKDERTQLIQELQVEGIDASPSHIQQYPWLDLYLKHGKKGLGSYLGTDLEIDFQELEEIIRQFKAGEQEIWLRRMGRRDTELWYEAVDFSETKILVVEWTHGNSDRYQGIDIPILLNSTPEETLEHRRSRNRDGKTDSPFTTMVLELEQKMLESQAHKARIIVSKSGEILTLEQYQKMMQHS